MIPTRRHVVPLPLIRRIACAMVCAGGATLTAADPDAGLVGHWRFDGGDGKAVIDRSGTGNDGAIHAAALRTDGAVTALALDGIASQVVIPLRKPLALTRTITTALWVRLQRTRNSTPLFGIPNDNPDWSTPVFGMTVSGDRIVYGQSGGKGIPKALLASTTAVPVGRWTHLAATADGTTMRFFIDGRPDAEARLPSAIIFNGRPLLIGAGLGSKPSVLGGIGELRIYDRVLSADEVHALCTRTDAGYDRTPTVTPAMRDGTVPVETHGTSPDDSRPWVAHPTRLLEKLDGYTPAADTVKLSRYGGWMEGEPAKATGFFRTQKVGGRWWLIDPDGWRFVHIAINAVRQPKAVKGDAVAWAEAVTRQLRGNGFNGLGNWSSTDLQQVAEPLVWVRRHDFLFAFARQKKLVEAAAGTQGFINRCMPVFHPEFPAFCEEYGKDLATTANDPRLLGIMTENEIQCPVDLLDRYLAADPQDADQRHGREAAAAWLTARNGTIDTTRITKRDRYEFLAYAFERYYRIVMPIVRKHDPNHLYLGSRLNYHSGQFDNPWFWRMLAPFHDVVSVNYYNQWGPQAADCADWAAWAGKPILITEWYAKALDVQELANTHGAGWLVRTQEDRARYYQHFALGCLEEPTIVGWHFFKYLDDPAESKALDAAGGANKGMFDLQGRPYPALFDRAGAVNREAYPLIRFFDGRRR